jgi:hypothetical protein
MFEGLDIVLGHASLHIITVSDAAYRGYIDISMRCDDIITAM